MNGKITVVGAGVSGTALARFASERGYSVFVTDKAEKLSDAAAKTFAALGIDCETGGHTPKCADCDLMVVSSGISEKSEAVALARAAGVQTVGELDFLSPYIVGKVIAVTGTNGKTTTTSLTAHLLRSNGLDAVAVGNIGEPLAAHVGEKHDAFVMELSSFQLHWNRLLAPDVSVLTNLAPDHIDWHGSYEAYIADKCRVFVPRGGECYAVTHECDAPRVPSGRKTFALGDGICFENGSVYLRRESGKSLLFEEARLPLLGRHNIENAAMACAAAALAFPGCDPSAGLSEYRPPRHRCEKVCEKNGVLYIDDSKGTNVAAVITALGSIDGTKVIILGGQGKGESYGELAQAVKKSARAAVLLGSEAEKIRSALLESGYESVHTAKDMPEAVAIASRLAQKGDSVLLSPACTSWDMYRNYGERGEHFASLVREL